MQPFNKFLLIFDFSFQCQQHEQFLASGERAGFLIGDGAGVGKGRTIAGIILENFLQGRKKAIWVCTKTTEGPPVANTLMFTKGHSL